jgi:hypothetical protein
MHGQIRDRWGKIWQNVVWYKGGTHPCHRWGQRGDFYQTMQGLEIWKNTTVSGCQLLDLCTGETLETCIEGMRLSREVAKLHPTVQGLGVDGKQATRVRERNKSHKKRSFRVE